MLSYLFLGVIFLFCRRQFIPGFGFWNNWNYYGFVGHCCSRVLIWFSFTSSINIVINIHFDCSCFLTLAKYGLLAKLVICWKQNSVTAWLWPERWKRFDTFNWQNSKNYYRMQTCWKKFLLTEFPYEAFAKSDFLSSSVDVIITEIDSNSIYIERLYKKGDKKWVYF